MLGNASLHPERGGLVVLNAIDHLPQVFQVYWRSTSISDDYLAEPLRIHQLTVRLERGGLICSGKDAGWQIDVLLSEGLLDFVNSHSARGQKVRIKSRPHREFLWRQDIHLRHALDHREPLRHQSLRVLVQGAQTECGGSE